MSLGGHIALCKASSLYLGSAVPIETAIGLEAFQMPCRERYWSALDDGMKVDGIDSNIIMYSSGLLMQYTGDRRSVTWFPIQSLHACAALTAVCDAIDGRPRFVALDSPEGASSQHAPMFCAIMRRTRGIKVLECHVFICKSTEAAMTMVQAMTHAFEHREGWLPDDAVPPSVGAEALLSGGGGTRIIPANQTSGNGSMQKFSINTHCRQPPAPPAPAPAPPPAVPAPPPPAPCPVNPPQPPAPVIQMVPVPVQNQYFANWDGCGGQAVMFIPESPINPQPHQKHKKHKKKKKKEKDEEEEEIYVLKKPGNREEYSEYYQSRAEPQPRGYQQAPNDLQVYGPSERIIEYIPQGEPRQDYAREYYGGGPLGPYGGGQMMQVPEEYFLAQQQYDEEQRAADLAAARYEAEARAVQDYNDQLQYNAEVAAAAGADYGGGGVPMVQYDPYLDGGYLVPSGNVGPVPMVNRYGELVDGLGYYP